MLVTGSAGFIGARLVEVLRLTCRRPVRAGFRSWQGVARLARLGIRPTPCDVLDADQVAKAMAGVDAVVHCAVGSPEVNIRGTANVLEAAKHSGVRRVVHLSTVEVYGDCSGLVAETSPLRATGDPYCASKIEAERVCQRFLSDGLPVVILRPSVVYGPFSTWWTLRPATRLASGRWRGLGRAGEGMCNALYVDDLIEAILVSLRHDGAVGQAFNINGPEIVTWKAFYERLNAALGLPAMRSGTRVGRYYRAYLWGPARWVGKRAIQRHQATVMDVYQRSSFAKSVMRYLQVTLQTTPALPELRLYERCVEYDGAKAATLLACRSRVGLDQGLTRSAAWLTEQGVISA